MKVKKKKERRKKRSTSAAAKRRAETHKTGFDNTAFELPDEMKQFVIRSDKALRLDIIPYEVGEGNPFADKGELHYERTFWVHRGIGADQTSYVCLRKTNDEACPICEFRAKLAKDPDADEDLIKDLAPKERQLFNIIDTQDKNKGVQLWEISFHLFGKTLDREIKNSDEDDNYENFAELEGGFTLKCGVEEKSFNRQSFHEIVSINFKPRSDDYDEDILEKTACLDDILIIKDYDELKEIFLQTTEGDGEDDKKGKKKDKKDKGEKSKKDDDDNWEKGDRVIVEVDGEDFHGELASVDDDDKTAKVEFDDGDTMDDVAFDDLEPEPEKKPKKDKGKKDDDDIPFEKGGRVIVEIDGTEYPGKITSVDTDDKTANVEFDDGDTMDDVDFGELTPEPEKKSKKDKGKKGKGKKEKGKKSKDEDDGNKCPGGGTFGKDTDDLTECNDCSMWDKCDDAN